VIDLPAVYGDLLRDFPQEELERFYRDALRRGERDLPQGDPGLRPMALLATAIPRINSASIAAYAIHILPRRNPTPEGDALDEQMLGILEEASTGALLRCHLAMDAELTASAAELTSGDEDTDAWLPVVFEPVNGLLAELADENNELEMHALAQDATRWLANSIDLLDQRHPQRVEAITDTLARLLPLTMFAHYASGHFPRA
jgi:hypothetical protein